MKTACSFILLGLTFITSVSAQLQYVGIPRHMMEYHASDQRSSQWCWAASIQMVFNYYGVDVRQEQIVERTFGRDPNGNLPDWAGNFENITRNLNNWGFDNRGRPYVVTAMLGQGAPTPAILLGELSNGRPVIVGYSTGPNTGHAVVVTAASYTPSPYGPMIQSLIVRDPWPSAENLQNRGRIEYPGAVLAQRMQHYWYVSIHRAP